MTDRPAHAALPEESRATVPLDALPDAELVGRCLSGVQAAWSTLVRRYQRLVYTVPLRAGLPEEAAADIFQTTFSRLFEHLERLQDPALVRAWLVTTAKRETLLQLERLQRQVPLPDESSDGGADGAEPGVPAGHPAFVDPAPLAEEALAHLQDLDRLRRALDRLEPRQRQLVEWLFLQEDPPPYAEVARRLGMSEGSIGPTRARCLARLRALWDDEG